MRRISVSVISMVLVLAFVVPASAAVAPSSSKMLKEQVASQQMIGALLGTPSNSKSWIKTMYFGKPLYMSKNKAVIPVSAYTRGGAKVKGRLVLYRYGGKWYFYSITRGSRSGDISSVKIPAGITTRAVKNSIAEQREHQWMLTGIINGGYKKLTVIGRGSNWNTRRVSVRMSGGTRDSVLGRVYGYRKTADSGKKYWFINNMK